MPKKTPRRRPQPAEVHPEYLESRAQPSRDITEVASHAPPSERRSEEPSGRIPPAAEIDGATHQPPSSRRATPGFIPPER